MTTDTYITRLEDVVKHPEMMPDLSSIRGDIACLLAAHRELQKQVNYPYALSTKTLGVLLGETPKHLRGTLVNRGWHAGTAIKVDQAEHTYECAKRE